MTAIVFLTATHLCFYLNSFGWQPELILNQLIDFALLAVCVVLAAVAFQLLRRFVKICTIDELTQVTHIRSQFSLWQWFLITAIAATVLALARMTPTHEDIGLAGVILGIIVFFLNSFLAVWAALAVGSIRWRFVLALLAGTLLELASWVQIFVKAGLQPFSLWSWLQTVSAAVSGMLPAAIAIASLLIVRSCGYRLVPKSTEPAGA